MTHSNSGPDQPEYPAPPVPADSYGSDDIYRSAELFRSGANHNSGDIYLSEPNQPPARKAGPGKKIAAGVAVLTVLAGGAIAAYAYTVLASSGIQPERVLPANTVAFAKLDLDPAANQKVALYRLSGKFPALAKGASNLEDEKNSALSSLFGKQGDLDYASDIKPWLGDRVALAAVPDAASKNGLDPVAAVAFTNEAKMKAALSKAARTQPNFGYAIKDGYALISDSQAHADAVLAGLRKGTLADNNNYRGDLKSLHGNQVAVGWADFGATTAALKAGAHGGSGSSGISGMPELDAITARGRVITGLHADSDYLELSAAVHGVSQSTPRAGGTALNGTLLSLSSADTSAALEISGLGDALTKAWGSVAKNPALSAQIDSMTSGLGLRLPADLAAVFGTDTTLSLHLPPGSSPEPEVAAQVSTPDAKRAIEVIDLLCEQLGMPAGSLQSETTATGYRVSNSKTYSGQASAGSPLLGRDPAFRKAVPDSAKAGLIGYVNIGSLLDADSTASAKDRADWKHLGAMGLSMTQTPDGGALTVRLTTR